MRIYLAGVRDPRAKRVCAELGGAELSSELRQSKSFRSKLGRARKPRMSSNGRLRRLFRMEHGQKNRRQEICGFCTQADGARQMRINFR